VFAKQKNVAGEALDRKILIDRADEGFFSLSDDAKLGRLGNRAAGSDRRQPRPAAGPQPAVDLIAMKISPRTIPRFDAIGKHLHDCVKALASEVSIGICPAKAVVEGIFVPFISGNGGDDLLGQVYRAGLWESRSGQACRGGRNERARDIPEARRG